MYIDEQSRKRGKNAFISYMSGQYSLASFDAEKKPK